MSEILQKTLKALVGQGEGVGWAPPTPAQPHSLSASLASALKQMAMSPRSEEKVICKKQIDTCDTVLKRPDTSPSTAAECIVRIIFVHLMGQDTSGLQMHAVKLAQAKSLLHRKLGYLACSIILPDNSEFRLLLTNCIMRELCTNDVPTILTGLIAACNLVCDKSVLSFLLHKVLNLLTMKSHLVRAKALITLDRFCQISPLLWCEIEKAVVGRLGDEDPSVVATAVKLLAKYLKVDPEIGPAVIDPLLHVQKQIFEKRFPPDFTYRGQCCPWVQIDILRVLSNLNTLLNTDQQLAHSVSGIIEKLLDVEFSKETILQVVLSETIVAVTKLDALSNQIPSTLKHVSKFLQNKHHHVKYAGLVLLHNIFTVSPPTLSASQEEAVLMSVAHPDPAIQRKSLALLTAIASKDNAKSVVDAILVHLKKTNSSKTKDMADRKVDCTGNEKLVQDVYRIVMSLSDDLDWQTSSILRLIQSSRGETRGNMVENLKFLISPTSFNKKTDAVKEIELKKVRRKIKKLLNNLVESGVRNPVILELYVWSIAQFSSISNSKEVTDRVVDSIGLSSECTELIEGVMSALLTIRLRSGSLHPAGLHLLTQYSQSDNSASSEKAERILKLIDTVTLTETQTSRATSVEVGEEVEEHLDTPQEDQQETLDADGHAVESRSTITEVEEIDCKEEGDVSVEFGGVPMDLTLSFLDQVVCNALCQGEPGYVPRPMRQTFPLQDVAVHTEEKKDEPILNATPYHRLRQDTVGSNSCTFLSTSPLPTLQAATLWTLDGRIEEQTQEGEILDLGDVAPPVETQAAEGQCKTKPFEDDGQDTPDPLMDGW